MDHILRGKKIKNLLLFSINILLRPTTNRTTTSFLSACLHKKTTASFQLNIGSECSSAVWKSSDMDAFPQTLGCFIKTFLKTECLSYKNKYFFWQIMFLLKTEMQYSFYIFRTLLIFTTFQLRFSADGCEVFNKIWKNTQVQSLWQSVIFPWRTFISEFWRLWPGAAAFIFRHVSSYLRGNTVGAEIIPHVRLLKSTGFFFFFIF